MIMIAGVASFFLGDSAGKLLGSHFGVVSFFHRADTVCFWRGFDCSVCGLAQFPRQHVFLIGASFLRALLIVGGNVCMLTALRTTSLATVFGAFFIGPIVAYVLGALLLKEAISKSQSILLLFGFIGVLLVVRPGFDMEAGVVFALMTGTFYGGFVVANRWLSDVARMSAMLFSQLIIGEVVLVPFGLANFPVMNWPECGLILASALFSLLGNRSLIPGARSET